MAAHEYYHPTVPTSNGRSHNTPYSPHDPYISYNSRPAQSLSPELISPHEDHSYRPYEHSSTSLQSPYFASTGAGGKASDPNPFADDVPLRQHPSKKSSDIAMQDHLPDDPAIIDRPPTKRKQRNRKRRFFSGKIPWVVYGLTAIQIVVFIAEVAKNGVLTGTPIATKPQFNPMIGPSPYVLINMGARFVPCMRTTDAFKNPATAWPCPNATSVAIGSPGTSCALNNLCGFGDGAYSESKPPRQWYRFILPIFLHAGIIHIAVNMTVQLLLATEVEREIGALRFILVYLSSGIFGFVLGGNFAPQGIAPTGASGSLFGVVALEVLDLFFHWGERKSPWVDLAWYIICIVISFAIGLLPGLDNFSHIGGFLMGLVLGTCLLHTPDILRRRVGADLPPYKSVRQSRMAMDSGGIKGIVKDPVAFFKKRKPLWWAWWLVRAAALIGVLVGFIVLLKNFYKANPNKCGWCENLTCLHVKNWCDVGKLEGQ